MINSRDIDDLTEDTAALCRAFVAACAAAGAPVLITSTFRDIEEQNRLYAKGRTTDEKKVTNVKGGASFHNWHVAFDFVPVVAGKAVWDNEKLWQKCGAIGISLGLEWGGSWTGFIDKPHMQNTGGRSCAQLAKV